MSDNTAFAFQEDSTTLSTMLEEMSRVIVGQDAMTRSLVLGLLTGGHVLLEGLPGLAKTLAVKTLATILDAKFSRIQFTPDLLPSDLIGTTIYRPETHEFVPKKGPIFANIVLADEINRAPAKVQSALLEAMAERQVTLADKTYLLEEPFLVLATQNPIENEGTYNLPEAQLDRFMFKTRVTYPNRTEERQVLELMGTGHAPETRQVFSTQGILRMRQHLDSVYMDDRIKEYIVRLVTATRPGEVIEPNETTGSGLNDIRRFVQVGASPRATLFLAKSARANAFLENRNFVTPDDVKIVAPDILRHRLILTFEAEAKKVSTDDVTAQLLKTIVIP
ncbi:MAG: MoxR family ATPase [Deltaproteobacteria bacterium]|nr:MoxR family ATPase [Deltaproteobacteria bacterium]